VSTAIGHTRYAVVLSAGAIILVAVFLFLVSTVLAMVALKESFLQMLRGEVNPTSLTVVFFQIVSLAIKAVAFYVIGTGVFSLFVGRLSESGGVNAESLSDLEGRIISVIVVILATSFVEHYSEWKDPTATLQFGVAVAAVIVALVLFQVFVSHEKK
jgi:uncharacterized membrane protein YqhA